MYTKTTRKETSMKEKLENIRDKHAEELHSVLDGKISLEMIKNFCDSLIFNTLDVVGQRMKTKIDSNK